MYINNTMNNSNNLDLDINKYSIKDLETFFKLNSKNTYKESEIELKEYQIREQLLKSGHIDKTFKRDLIEFLKQAKEWLIKVKCKNSSIENHSYRPTQKEQDIIIRPETQFIYANPDEYFQGKLNPLTKRTITKCINIDSRFRNNLYETQSSDFIVQLPTRLNKVVSMQLASFEIPLCFYGITDTYGNNYLTLTINYNSIPSTSPITVLTLTKTIVVPDGNYTASDLVDTMNTLLADPITPTNIFNAIQFVLDINTNGSGTGKLTISPTGTYAANINTFTLDFSKDKQGMPCQTNIVSKLGWNLGYIKSTYSGMSTYTAEGIIEPSTTRYIYLGIDDFNNSSHNHFVNINTDCVLNKDILARISLKGSNFSIMMENNMNIVSEPRAYFGPVDIQKIRIRLYDEFGRTLQTNYSNFSFCLNVKMLYDL